MGGAKMAKIPERKNATIPLINLSHENRKEPPRPHLGASQIGHECDRWLWLSFRWAVIPEFKGRILRLFRRGHHEEIWIVQDLRAIGVDIHSTGGSQARVDFGAHFSGSIDGIIESGLPESPNKKHVAEFKTHSLKSFKDLQENGVKASKPMHYAQMQVYMRGLDINRAFYIAVCKDNDELYTERLKLDEAFADGLIEKGRRIALENFMPPALSDHPGWYQCKFCDAYDFCHATKTTKEVNCRTCAYSTALENSTFRCEKFEADNIPYEFQLKGCESHAIHPDLVPYKHTYNQETDEMFFEINGKQVLNGPGGYASGEILANPDMLNDRNVDELRKTFNARITG